MKSLAEMKKGEKGAVREIAGCPEIISRLESMGFRIGKKIIKISSVTSRGPVVVSVERSSLPIAIGFGMARKISVEINK